MSTRGKFWVTEPDQEVDIQLAPVGFGSIQPKTVTEVLTETVRKHGSQKALCLKRPVNVSQNFYLILLDGFSSCFPNFNRARSPMNGKFGLGTTIIATLEALPKR